MRNAKELCPHLYIKQQHRDNENPTIGAVFLLL